MAELINAQKWQKVFSKPDWYAYILDDFKKLEEIASKEKDYDKRKAIKAQAYDLIEEALLKNQIFLARAGKNFDAERLPIDTIVVHHTANKPGMTLGRLNTIHLLRLYARFYNNPRPGDEDLKEQPVWSGHFYQERQVFWGYHWLIRQNGIAEHLLDDKYIGWHSGRWDVNRRSVAICIDDYLQDKEPSDVVLASVAKIIKTQYLGAQNIVGHLEVNPNTECPGNLFLPSWKNKIIKLSS